ncbi:MAG: NAD(P)-dependent oxidoreductase [Pseudomonadota bacterium]
MTTLRAGVLGLGAMGAPMAANLAKEALLGGVWNRTSSVAAELSESLGCLQTNTPADLASDCDVLITNVSADADVLNVVDQLLPGLREGKLVLDCSTTSPQTARDAAQRVATRGAQFLDCPVTGGTEGAVNATLAILVGGEFAAFERALPVLSALGRRITHMGPVGAGQVTKAVNQIMVAGINQAVSEGMALAQAEDLDLEAVIATLSTGAAGSWFLQQRGPNMRNDTYPLGFKVALHAKDLAICRAIADEHDVRLPVVEMTLLHYERLLARDPDAEEDISSLFRLKRGMFAGDDS